ISCYTQALQEHTRDRFPMKWAMTQNNLGNAYRNRIRGERAENLEIAISCYTQALQEYTRDRFPIEWAGTQNNLGNAYSVRIRGERAENLELAISCYTQALQERTRDRFPIDWAMTQNNLGAAYRNRIRGERAENLEIAISCYTQALQERTRDRFPIDWATTQKNLGAAYRNRIRGERAENLEIAISCCTNALQVRTRNALPQNHAETAFNLGLAYIDAEQYADAYNIFQSAIDTVEFLRGEIVCGDEIKQKLAEEWNELYRRMVEVCLELEYYDQAVEYIERSKTRNLVELIASQKPFQPLHELDQKIAEELEHIRFAEIQALVDDCTAIVQWYIFDNCFRAFIITRDNQHPIIWKSSQQDLEDLNKWSDEYLETYATDKPRWRYQLAAKLSELAEILHINDILDFIPSSCQALILVPHRYLHLLPLHALPIGEKPTQNLTPLGNGDNSKPLSLQERGLERGSTDQVKSKIGEEGNCLLDKFPGGVRYAPSCQLLKLAKSRNPTPNPSPQARRGTRTGGEESRSLFAIQDPNENLLYTNIEVETIERDFQPTTVIEKRNATKQALFQTPAFESLSQAQVIHFSCHGYFDRNSPVDSAIALADCISPIPADADSSKRCRKLANGDAIDLEKCLTLPDIFNLNLPECRLVTLSACETGLSDPFSTSDEYIGLPSGFLKAGSSSIVSSLWSVDDFATALLMIRFYDNQHSLAIAQALCQAQRWLRNSTQAELIEWAQNHLNIHEEHKQTIQQRLQTWYFPEHKPFRKPEAWAGFCAIGQ
ncbi:CHAT domain-containing protein, partial [Scytonema sp. HK-05]|uniref:CHAT domain-containing protein n=1 Tax=Scytonema sp. HK-05 TaxID=1137095 RepID=UPI000936AA2A